MVQDFEMYTEKELKKADTPGYPGTTLEPYPKDQDKLNIDGYQSFLRQAMFYSHKVALECANAIRKLA